MKIFSHHCIAAPGNKSAVYRDPEQRVRELSRLLPLWPAEIEDGSLSGRRRLVGLMERALRAERARGQSGHWAYDLSRHAARLTDPAFACDALSRKLSSQNDG